MCFVVCLRLICTYNPPKPPSLYFLHIDFQTRPHETAAENRREIARKSGQIASLLSNTGRISGEYRACLRVFCWPFAHVANFSFPRACSRGRIPAGQSATIYSSPQIFPIPGVEKRGKMFLYIPEGQNQLSGSAADGPPVQGGFAGG